MKHKHRAAIILTGGLCLWLLIHAHYAALLVPEGTVNPFIFQGQQYLQEVARQRDMRQKRDLYVLLVFIVTGTAYWVSWDVERSTANVKKEPE